MDSRHTVHRVYPSISALSNALAYGSDVKLAKKVGPIGRDRIIEGVEYDKVIIAAEAPAVPLIVPWADPDPNANMLSSLPGAGNSMFTSAKRQGNSVFDRVEYHPSRICIHRDPSMMPQNRSDWQMINVRHDVGQDMAELTVWLNQYYPDLPHQTDVFQTWNPFRTPGNVIKELHFMRCLHTRHTAALVKKIEGLQVLHLACICTCTASRGTQAHVFHPLRCDLCMYTCLHSHMHERRAKEACTMRGHILALGWACWSKLRSQV